MSNDELTTISQRYKKSLYRDDEELAKLDNFGLASLLFSLHTSRFDITGFSEKGYAYYYGYTDNFRFLNHVSNSNAEDIKRFLLS